jgi:asparagine N-glycosylation enzyme membrane subunit Stt3
MMILSAVAYPGWFRFYAIATVVVVVGFGIASSFAMSGIDQDDTPWAGGFERINAYAYFAWLVLLAVKASRCAPTGSTVHSDARPAGAGHGRGVPSR